MINDTQGNTNSNLNDDFTIGLKPTHYCYYYYFFFVMFVFVEVVEFNA